MVYDVYGQNLQHFKGDKAGITKSRLAELHQQEKSARMEKLKLEVQSVAKGTAEEWLRDFNGAVEVLLKFLEGNL